MKKLIILLLFAFSLNAQPNGNGPGKCPPACFNKNPPFWCDCNQVPLDDYLPLLMLGGVLLGTFIIYKRNLNLQNEKI